MLVIDSWMQVSVGAAGGLLIVVTAWVQGWRNRRRYVRQEHRDAMIRGARQATAMQHHLAWSAYFKGAADSPAIDLPSDHGTPT